MLKKHIINLYLSLPHHLRRLGSNYNKVHDLSLASRSWTLDEISNWQLLKFKEIVRYAYQNTDGYRQLYNEAGISPEDIQSISDISHLPMVSKSLIRDNLDAFTSKASDVGHVQKVTTGGSTGIPFEFYLTRSNLIAEEAFVNESWERLGWRETDYGIKLRGTYIGAPGKLLKKDGFHRYAISSSFLTDENYANYINLIRSSGASFLHVYPSSLTDLCSMINNHHDEGLLPIKYIFLGSEYFYDWQKEIITQAFPHAKLMSFYGLTEHTVFASWCEKSELYHVNPIYGYTELVKDGFPVSSGEVGEIVGTSFWNKGTIFIRYRTNDYASLNHVGCEKCGCNWPVLKSIDGRLAEIIVGRIGRRISLTVFAGSIMHGKNFEHIKQFRFIQYVPGELILAVVPTEGFTCEDKCRLEGAISSFLGDDFSCQIKLVSELQKTKRGKFSYLEQHLSIERTDINI